MSDSFVFYRSFEEIIEQIPDADTQLKMYKALAAYGLDGKEPELPYPLNLVFMQMQASISGAKRRYEKQTTYGRKGGAPKGNQNAKNHGAPKGNQNAKKQTKTNNLNVNDNVNDNDNVNVNVNDNISVSAGTRLDAVPPPQGWEWITKVVENDGEHYRRARNLTTGEKEVIRLD